MILHGKLYNLSLLTHFFDRRRAETRMEEKGQEWWQYDS